MTRARATLMAVSVLAVGLVLGGGLFIRVGAADSTYRKAVLFSEVLSLVLENYVDPVEPDRLLDGAYEGMLAGLGARSAFLTPAEVDDWVAAPRDPSAGPGVTVLKVFGGFQVVSVEPDSPAADAGIVPGDQFRTIDGVDLSALSFDQGMRALLGEAGSVLRVDVVHPDDGFRRETVELRRQVSRGEAYSIELRDGIAVVTLHAPARIDVERLRRDLGDARSAGAGRLLLDLRNVVEADSRRVAPVAGLFADGPLLRLRSRSREEPIETVSVPEGAAAAAWEGPVAVLVNGGTAGASEALAGVLHARIGAAIYGEPTYGLGSEAELFRLPDGSGVLLASRVWELSDGGTWDREGVEPDETVRGSGATLPDRLRSQLDETLRIYSSGADDKDESIAA